jgi:UV excision repair protein RAD23
LSNPRNQQTTQQTTNQNQQNQGGSGDDNPLAFLLNDPNFPRLRAAIQQNPQLIQPLIAQLAQTNPQILQLISQNQEAFMTLLMEGGPSTGSGSGSGGRGGSVIRLTQEEKAAVDRVYLELLR